MTPTDLLVRVLARSFLAGEQTLQQVVARATATLGRSWDWLPPLALRYLAGMASEVRPRHREVVRLILEDAGFRTALFEHPQKLVLKQWVSGPQMMQPAAAAETWNVPAIETVGALADWLWLETGDVDWFADLKALGYKKTVSRLRHYNYRSWQSDRAAFV